MIAVMDLTVPGPLAATINGRKTLIGVVSWGFKFRCSNDGHPSVFARVSKNLKWILDNSDAGKFQDKCGRVAVESDEP